MAIKKDNTRLQITFSKKQVEWLQKTSKKTGMQISKLIRWLISNNISKLVSYIPEKEMKELIKIAKTPWIEDEENYY